MAERMPAIFVGHGSPMNAIEDNRFSRGWEEMGRRLPRPRAILSVSAHWYTHGMFTYDAEQPQTVYDMYGFPKALYDVSYPAPGDPKLAHEVQGLLGEGVGIDNSWGIDHGTWSVLHRMMPAADVPVVQLSVNADASPAEHLAAGRALACLRDEGVMIFGSGNVVHNLMRVDWESDDGADWNKAFDAWVRERIEARDLDSVVDYPSAGSIAALSVPTPDHFLPLLTVLGASSDNDVLTVFNDSYTLGSMAMTSYLFE